MSHYLAIKIDNDRYEHFKVPKEVYIYVKQLENCIKYPEDSKLKELYADRFANTPRKFEK